MATITRENIGVLNEKIIVKVMKDDYLPSFEKAIKDYSKKANIPGFRKGMVPVGMIKKLYGSSVFNDEVIKSVEKELTEYMSSEKLEIFAQPMPITEQSSPQLDMNQPSEYAFAFEVGLKPEFTITNLAQTTFTRYKVDVTEQMVEEEISHLQQRYGQKQEEESIASEDSVLYLTFIQSDAEGNELEAGIRKVSSIPVSFFTPSFREGLMGRKIDDQVILDLSSAFEENKRQGIIDELGVADIYLQEGNAFFKAVITKIERTDKAVLNEDFFKQVYPDKEITSATDLRNEVKQVIQAEYEKQSHNQLLDQIYHKLIDQTSIEFPEDFLKRWMQTSNENQKTPEEVEREFPAFVNQLKWTLIVDKIVQDCGIEVNPEDIRESAKIQLLSYMGGYHIDGDQPWINDYVEKMMKDKKFVEDSFHRIRTEKIFDWAETQVNPVEAIIPADEFTRLQHEHKH
ncbi:MAG: trigger factor [Chitinophagaceae bacterium]